MLYPLKFQPLLKEKIWGGRKLGTLLAKRLPEGALIGESWEIADHPNGTSLVANGPLKNKSLHELYLKNPSGLLGSRLSACFPDRFPLLVKFIDASDKLSIQVHPGDEYARTHENGSFGKTEAWYVLHAEPGSFLIAGLSRKTTAGEFEKALENGSLEPFLRRIPVNKGDFIQIPAGRLHAIMPGIVLNEIQQNSDITYRVYDWDRKDGNGRSRPLHVRRSLETIDFSDTAAGICTPEPLGDGRFLLTENGYFRTEKTVTGKRTLFSTDRDKSFHIHSVMEGSGCLEWKDGWKEPVRAGDSLLIPFVCGEYGLVPDGQGPVTTIRTVIP